MTWTDWLKSPILWLNVNTEGGAFEQNTAGANQKNTMLYKPRVHDNVSDRPPAQSVVQIASPVRGVGIHAMSIYTPANVVSQAAMEDHHRCPGKYTKGLFQDQIGFCDNNEDVVSMALTAVTKLMRDTQTPWNAIGRLEVGTS